jgi:site-specific recombinase XerD
MDYRTANRRQIKPAAARVLGHAEVSWHSFRHAAATYADWVQMPMSERIALMGHTRAAMTLHYTHADIDRRRPYLAAVENLIFPQAAACEPVTTEPQE